MAGSFGASLAGAFQGYDQYQKEKQNRELQAIDLLSRQQQLRLEQQKADMQAAATLRSQKADENAAGILQGFYGGAQQPAAQTPPPQPPGPQAMPIGQPSVPMQQPGQRPPVPPQAAQGQMPPAGAPPLPPGPPGQPQAAPAAPPPYRRIDTQLQQQQAAPQPQQSQPQQPVQIPQQAPVQGSLTFRDAVQQLQAKGVQGPALVDALDRIKPYLDEEAKSQAAALKQQVTVQKMVMDGMKLQMQGNRDAALESYRQAELGLRQLQISATRENTASNRSMRQETIDLERQRLEDSKIPTGYQRGKDGKLEPMPGGPFDPQSPNYKVPKGQKTGSIADRMNPTMLASVKLDIQEGRNALDTVKKLTTDTAGPFFAHDQASPLSSLLGRSMTTEQQQQYEVSMNRMAVAIASVQSMGRGQISDAKVNEARKLVPQLGDKLATRQLKLQQISKIFDMADRTLNQPAQGNPAEPDQDREAATAGSVPGGGNLPPGWSVKVH